MTRNSNETLPRPARNPAQSETYSPPLDLTDYADDLSGLELTKEQEAELLETLWSIMWSFVQLGFEVDILQLFVPDEDSDAVESKDTTTIKTTFNANGKERAT
ncbi:hypothetical protein [Oricola indica]|uniref:hypothetical protein n=1 Tax=Oricola indica TaxID=2872591 RepID=UPI001CBFA5AC|nr:hypothetical protein [Oricola indica]